MSERCFTEAELVAAFSDARMAAAQADPGEQCDGGACNLDSLVVHLRGTAELDVWRAASAAYVRVSRDGDGSWLVFVPEKGQADRRTKMIEAAATALKAHGVPAFVQYQMD